MKGEYCENSVHFFKLQGITVYMYDTKKEMATHTSILAWRILRTGEPGVLPSMGVTQSWTQLKRLGTRKKWASQAALVVKNLPANAGDIRDANLIPGWARSPGEGNGNPLQSSCLGNPMDRGAWQATVQKATKSRTQLSTRAHREAKELNISFGLIHML